MREEWNKYLLFIYLLLKVLRRRSTVSTLCFKIIALSSVLSWGGRRYPKIIADGDAEFKNRVPMACAANEYNNENTLVCIHTYIHSFIQYFMMPYICTYVSI